MMLDRPGGPPSRAGLPESAPPPRLPAGDAAPSQAIVHIDAGGCRFGGMCAEEARAALARTGQGRESASGGCDVLVLTGLPSRWELPDGARVVVACGDCACASLPPGLVRDVRIPGCPMRAGDLMEGLMLAMVLL